MTYNEMKDKVLQAFEKLDGKEQCPYVTESMRFVLEDFSLMPMEQLPVFCKEYFADDYYYLLAVMGNSFKNGHDFTLADKWALWIQEEERFMSTASPFVFIKRFGDLYDELVEEIFMDKNGLKKLGFTEEEEKKLEEAYIQYDEGKTKELKDFFFPEDEEQSHD